MFRLTFRYLRERQQAEDAMMNGFYKVFTHFSSFEYRGPGSLDKWITRIMVNESLMQLRGPKIHWMNEEASAQQESADYPTHALDAEVLYAYIRQLPDGYRTVFNLHALEGYSHEEIALQLGISEGTSKSQLSKARTLLQKWIRNSNENEYEYAGPGQASRG